MKSKCIPVVVTTDQVDLVQVNETASMLTYRLSSGPLKGCMLFVNRIGEADKRTDVTISNPQDPMMCLATSPEGGTWNQELSENGQEVTIKGSTSMVCDKKTYCIDFSYTGPVMRSPGMSPQKN
jgi:hypothetical protein